MRKDDLIRGVPGTVYLIMDIFLFRSWFYLSQNAANAHLSVLINDPNTA